ncbi:MAG TPA: hypothetical protein VIW92_13775 [Thermoanaerobaculia bacterium]
MEVKVSQGVEQEVRPAAKKRKIRRKPTIERLKAERVEERLKDLPGWRSLKSGIAIERIKSFPTSRAARAYASYASELAESLGQFASVNHTVDQVILILYGPLVCGRRDVVTDPSFALAKQFG